MKYRLDVMIAVRSRTKYSEADIDFGVSAKDHRSREERECRAEKAQSVIATEFDVKNSVITKEMQETGAFDCCSKFLYVGLHSCQKPGSKVEYSPDTSSSHRKCDHWRGSSTGTYRGTVCR